MNGSRWVELLMRAIKELGFPTVVTCLLLYGGWRMVEFQHEFLGRISASQDEMRDDTRDLLIESGRNGKMLGENQRAIADVQARMLTLLETLARDGGE